MTRLDPLPAGIVTPLLTFLTESGDPDKVAMNRLVDHQVENGIHGLLTIGSTGEVGGMTPDQRVKTVEIVTEAAAGRVPVWAGVPGLGTQDTMLSAKRAEAAGADALLVLPPFYMMLSDDELERHFTMVAEAVDVPIIVYDVPPVTPRKIPADVYVSLGEKGVIRGFKDSSGDLNAGRLEVEATSHIDGFRPYIGSEITMDLSFQMGFHGMVPGFANVLPRAAVDVFEAFQRGDREAERAAQLVYIKLFKFLFVELPGAGFTASAIAAMKIGAAHVLDLPNHYTSVPMTGTTAQFVDGVMSIVAPLTDGYTTS